MATYVTKYVGPDLAKLFDNTPVVEASRRMADRGGDRLHDFITAFSPIRTGNLATSWSRTHVRQVPYGGSRAYETRVQTEVDYAPYVNYGTGLWGPQHRKYLIEPKPPNTMLSWVDPISGRRMYARKVWHPGSPGQHMVEKGASIVEATLPEMMQPELERYKHAQEQMGREAMVGVVLP